MNSKKVQIAKKNKDPPPTFVEGFHDVEKVSQMQYNNFGNTGYQVSKLGLDTSEYSDANSSQCKEALKMALQAGVNYINTGLCCDKSYEIVGECLKNIPRRAYYIASSFGCNGQSLDFSPQRIEGSIEKALKILGLDYIDVIQIANIEKAPSLNYLVKETLPVLVNAVEQGKAKFIGVSGYPLKIVEQLIAKFPQKIDVITSHSRFTVLDHSLLGYEEIFKDLGVVNASSLGFGLFTNKGPEESHPAPELTKAVCEEARVCCVKKRVKFEKFAVHHVFRTSKYWPHTHIIAIENPENLQMFLETIFVGLCEREYRVFTEVEMDILVKSRFQDWEDSITCLPSLKKSFYNI